MAQNTIISADSHVFEPINLWESRIDKPRQRVPQGNAVRDGAVETTIGTPEGLTLLKAAGGKPTTQALAAGFGTVLLPATLSAQPAQKPAGKKR